jgi:hypothetical protein
MNLVVNLVISTGVDASKVYPRGIKISLSRAWAASSCSRSCMFVARSSECFSRYSASKRPGAYGSAQASSDQVSHAEEAAQ